MASISVRALRHYDEIGLLVPSARSAAGYRLYDETDLLRLQQIMIERELGLSLEEIRRSLDDPAFDLRASLCAQKRALELRNERTTKMIRAVETALATLDAKEPDMKQLFDGFDPSSHEEETQRRWGDTDAYAESKRRTKGYTKEDWKKLAAEQASIYADAAAVRANGNHPSDEAAMDVAERHRVAIDRWFYPCSPTMHEKLAELYESDPRFAANIDKHGEGLTPFLVEAIRANAARG